jgi:hypothetical protein
VTESKNRIEKLRIHNSQKGELVLWLEPWGDRLEISAGGNCEILAEGPRGDHLEVDIGMDSVRIYGWSGSILSVYQEGRRIWASTVPAPSVPDKQA